MSPSFISSIDFNKGSTTIKFKSDDEIKDTDESVNVFCGKLDHVIETHLFCKKLNSECLKKDDAKNIIEFRCEEISSYIEEISQNTDLRDAISKRIVRGLYDICYGTLILNADRLGYTDINERLAWEVSQFKAETKYLSNFLKGLNYIGYKLPAEGQSERLMLKYCSYLWEIREFLKDNFDMCVLENLEKFPLNLDTLDAEYYEVVANSIEGIDYPTLGFRDSRYNIQNEIPFFVNGKRYFEITLQLAGKYATKYNRITVYCKERISTKYSIQIAFTETNIDLWNVKSKIKVLTQWKVSIDPSCMNKLCKILGESTKITRRHGEYQALMDSLTESGMNLLEIIDLQQENFDKLYECIYGNTNTHIFGDALLKLRSDYAHPFAKKGIHIVRYLMLNMDEELLEDVMPNSYNNYTIADDLNIRSQCYPFEKNPLISQIVEHRVNKNDVLDIINDKEYFKIAQPYLKLEQLIKDTGEIYFDLNSIGTENEISSFNDVLLDDWERENGYSLKVENNMVCIDSYENYTLYILRRLLEFSKKENDNQKGINQKYLDQCKKNNVVFTDERKEYALKNAFVHSNLMLIYGAAGTGKTTLIGYLAELMNDSKKLFVAVTHTAKQNIQRKIKNINDDDDVLTMKSVCKRSGKLDYDVVFVDECSTVDNRMMKSFLEKISDDTILVLSGDIYQIESIDFGNWFSYAKEIIDSKESNVELLSTWRTDEQNIIDLWNEVRDKSEYNIITEKLAIGGEFSEVIGEKIFERLDPYNEDEVILCLNYDGKFGLNNMNLYLQNVNPNKEVFTWAEWTYKIGDPIVFIDSQRSALLYNNLKGQIVDIEKNDYKISFTIDAKINLTASSCRNEKFEFIENNKYGTRIRLEVIAWNDDMPEESKVYTTIPFQIAYAVSIHKAQGLEYDSVKVVIPNSNTEQITHSIFYTAITRAKKNLKIFWSAETMDKIVKSFSKNDIPSKSLEIIKRKIEVDHF